MSATNSTADLITFKQNFKKVGKKDSPKYGQTRESIKVSFTNTKEYYREVSEEKIVHILNEAVTQYAKKLILENTDDWNYVPSIEQLTLDELYTDLTTATARTRILTNKNIDSWFVEFASLATSAGKSQAYIQTIQQLAKDKFSRLSGEENAERLTKVAEFFTELDDDFRDEMNKQVNGKWLELFTEMLSAETLELSLDSLD